MFHFTEVSKFYYTLTPVNLGMVRYFSLMEFKDSFTSIKDSLTEFKDSFTSIKDSFMELSYPVA